MQVITEGSPEYITLFVLTIIIIIIKSVLCVFLLFKINKKKKEIGKLKLDLLLSIFIFILCLLVSRILLLIFDFVYTKFDNTTYYLEPQIFLWKISFVLVFIGLSIFIYTIDRKALNFKFKGIFSYLEILTAIFIIIFPANNLAEYQLLLYLTLIGTFIAIIIPIFFFYLAKLAPSGSDMRKTSISLAFGIVIYGIGANGQSENILIPASIVFGSIAIVLLLILSLILKTIGLTILAYSATKIKA